MPKKINEVGNKYSRLEVLDEGGSDGKNILWRCRCLCGKLVSVAGTSLRTGKTKSCGCLRIETNISKGTTHGHSGTRTYQAWLNMKSRCSNKKHISYENYGGRGISVCDRWINSFENFLEDMGECPDNLTLERMDVNGNYEPNNCIWEDCSQQLFNQSLRSTNKSGIVGVNYRKDTNKWESRICKSGKIVILYCGDSFEKAVEARKEGEIKYYGFNPNR